MVTRIAPPKHDQVLHIRQLKADELEEVRASKRCFKEAAWDEWRTTQPLEFDGYNHEFKVVSDFPTDLVSVPNIFSWFIPRAGRYARAAVLHDYLWRRPMRINRRDADRRFRRQMELDGVGMLRRWIMWAAVRAISIGTCKGGPGSWKDAVGAGALLLFVALPIVLVPALAIVLSIVVFWIVESLVALFAPGETVQWPQVMT
jgi:hypothetical protein